LTVATAIPNFFVVRNERREEDNMTNSGRAFDDNVYDLNVYDLNAILHSGAVYDHPRDVLADEELTLAEKRRDRSWHLGPRTPPLSRRTRR
jgi:hypothetical protein